MPKTSSLVDRLSSTFPDLSFEKSDDFRWSAKARTVYFVDGSDADLLHETAHGLLRHDDYHMDIDLLKMERDAWTYALEELAPRFNVEITEDTIEDTLDSYRDWLHARSRCPHCSQTGIQTDSNTYSCLGCNESWHVNEARRCALRRYKLDSTKTPAL